MQSPSGQSLDNGLGRLFDGIGRAAAFSGQLDDVFVDQDDEEPSGTFVAVTDVGSEVGAFAAGVLEEMVDDEVQLVVGTFVKGGYLSHLIVEDFGLLEIF